VKISGPFLADPNVHVIILSMDDRLWIVNRRAVQDEPTLSMFGLLEFVDVRAYRVRPGGEYLDSTPGSWATEVPNSEYWDQVVGADEQRDRAALAQHKHYAVRDGNHRTVDVIAREARVRALAGDVLSEIHALAAELALDFG
jgi:hypothetical protein